MVAASTGIISTIAGNGTEGYSGDGGPATTAEISSIDGISLDAGGNVYISDEFNGAVRKVTCPVCTQTSVPVINNTRIIAIYPNPAATSLTLTFTENINSIIITNLIGQTVYTQKYNTPQVQVDVAALSSGIYFVKVNGTEVRKFVKE